MRIIVKILLGVVVVLAVAVVLVVLRPVEASRLIWPWVETAMLDDFVGITTHGTPQTGLFAIQPTGLSTQPVLSAAQTLLQSFTPQQRQRLSFAIDADEWRRWANIHISARQGIGFAEMNPSQQSAVWALLEAGLSPKGFTLARDITRLEEHLAELKDDHYQYGEQRYWITLMGTPSVTEPWGWQFEGHHLVINYFVLGDQVVMTPTFMGSEPVIAASGKYQGTQVLQTEQALGLALVNALTAQQRSQAVISDDKPGNNNYGELFQDNAIVPRQGLVLAQLQGEALALAEQLIRAYIGNLADDFSVVRMQEIRAHWDQTRFAWVGPTGPDAVFYYRIFSPVVMIEFDHQSPVALPGEGPSRRHVHTVVRTPNGNDYGKDLLRQHLLMHPH